MPTTLSAQSYKHPSILCASCGDGEATVDSAQLGKPRVLQNACTERRQQFEKSTVADDDDDDDDENDDEHGEGKEGCPPGRQGLLGVILGSSWGHLGVILGGNITSSYGGVWDL